LRETYVAHILESLGRQKQSLLGQWSQAEPVRHLVIDGVLPDDEVVELATGWYRKAAEQGVAEAQWLLGQMYADGEGVPQDDVQAFAWMAISAMGLDEFGRSMLDTLRGRTTASQIEAARKLSNEYAAKVPP